MEFAIRYNQQIPPQAGRSGRRGHSAYREPCMKIISGDADNAMLNYQDEVQAKRGQSTCYGYIHKHQMNLKTCRRGKSVYIFRAQ